MNWIQRTKRTHKQQQLDETLRDLGCGLSNLAAAGLVSDTAAEAYHNVIGDIETMQVQQELLDAGTFDKEYIGITK